MATKLLNSDSRRLYSWWWDSHISPKNSKWLQENLTDMDGKVKSMIKLIEEDADSFARRAEMYYKKRPELMKLVEEFYRAYRALAERYDHATMELRQAHRTIAQTYTQFDTADDSNSSSSSHDVGPHTPEMPHPIRALFDLDDLQKDAPGLSPTSLYSEDSDFGMTKNTLKQLNEMLKTRKGLSLHNAEEKEPNSENGLTKLSNENQTLKNQIQSESERASKAERDIEALTKTLKDMQSERETVLAQYQKSLEDLSNLEKELSSSQKEARAFDERATKAGTKKRKLKDSLLLLEAEKDDALLKNKQCAERISKLEAMISLAQNDAKELSDRAIGAETEAQKLKQDLSRMEDEKEAANLQYKQCLEKISSLENKLLLADEWSVILNEQKKRAEADVNMLRKTLNSSNEEKEALALRYKECLETIASLKNELISAQENVKRLNNEILNGKERLKSSEEQVSVLDKSNQSLRSEVLLRERELSDKNEELAKLQLRLQNEHSRISELESTLFTSQQSHNQSQEDQKGLAMELRDALHMLKEMEISKRDLEEEIRRVNEENQSLNEINLSSVESMHIMENDITSLKEMKEKLEDEASRQVNQSNLLEEEVSVLKEEINDMNDRYQALLKQVSSMMDLEEENSKLKEIYKHEKSEKEALSKNLGNMEKNWENKVALESSLLDMSAELDRSKEKVKELQEFIQFLQGEKSNLGSEKAALFSHLQNLTENIHKLWAKNALLENSLANANVELASLREKSKFLDEICQLLRDEKSSLVTERDSLFMQMTNAQGGLEKLENRFTELEEKYTSLAKEKSSLESCFDLLREERKLSKKDFEEELDKAVNAQVEIFILQKFIQDLEEKNLSLMIECQKHVEESKLSDKLIVELESESLEQQMEAEFLLDEIEKLRRGITRVFKTLQIDDGTGLVDKIENEHSYLPIILQWIEKMKYAVSRNDDEKQKLQVENLVLVTLLEQLKSEGAEFESKIDQDLTVFKEKSEFLQNEIRTIIKMNTQLRLEVSKGDQEKEMLHAELEDMREDYYDLQDSNLKVLEENKSLLSKCSDLDEKVVVLEYAKGVLSLIFKSFGIEKALELKTLDEEMKKKLQYLNDRILIEKESLVQRETALSKAQHELKATEKMNMELCRTIEILKRDSKESKVMSDYTDKRVFELSRINTTLTKEIEKLHEKIAEHQIREEFLSSELQEKSNEFQVWEAEAATFYFDFQFSAIREVLAENKVHELTGVCETLKQENAAKSVEIEQMIEKVNILESETGILKAQLSAYAPVIVSLKDDIASLEDNTLLRSKINSTEIRESEDMEGSDEFEEKNCVEVAENVEAVRSHGIIDLQKMRSKIKAVEKAVMRQPARFSKPKSVRTRTKPKACVKEIESPECNRTFSCKEKTIQAEDHEFAESTNGTRMKDILLDQPSDCAVSVIIRRKNGGRDEQMLELWQTAEQNCTTNTKVKELIKRESTSTEDTESLSRPLLNKKSKDPFPEVEPEKDLGINKLELSSASFRERSKEASKRRILERLTSDAQKLTSVQGLVQDLRKKTGTSTKKSKKGTYKDLEYETTKEHLQEVEEAAVELMDINCQLRKSVETPSFSDIKEVGYIHRKRVLDQAKKGSEKIGRLQVEVQKIQYALVKLEDEKKSKVINKFSTTTTRTALKNFIHLGRSKTIKRRKKPCLCGCLRPATAESEVSN